jgi:hypothetical protein
MKKIKDYKDKLEWMRNLKKYSSYFQNDKFLNNIEIIKKYINSFIKSPTTAEYRYLELLCDLCSLYDDNIQEKLIEYKNESKTSIKVKIRYGDARQEKYIESLKCKPKPIPNSWTMISYWTKKGYTEDEAVVLRSIKQSKAAKNAAKKRKENNNYKGESPHQYYIGLNWDILHPKLNYYDSHFYINVKIHYHAILKLTVKV